MASGVKGRSWIDGVQKLDIEENIWTEEGQSNMNLEGSA
jgi:hypothetical protein